tara:strand:- start:1563 stop:2141 length:579 start_codon:yes stop_codon:yes gene_type:complete
MKPNKDYFFVHVEKTHEDTVEVNGRELFLDTSYDELKHARQYGTVVGAPRALSMGHKRDIKEGDKVYCHHFLVNEENRVNFLEQDNVYKIFFESIYARVRDGELKMVSHWNFVKQKVEDESNYMTKSGIYTKPEAEDEELHGYVCHMNDELKSWGVKIGDEVIFSKNSEYDMQIEGEKLLRMRNFDILAIVS